MGKRIKWSEHFKKYGVEYKGGKIKSPLGWICKPLKKGNGKLGETVWSWSILPGTRLYNVVINGASYTVKGTCVCECDGCYAFVGRYVFDNVRRSLAVNTILTYDDYIDFLRRVLCAMLEAIEEAGGGEVRIHVSGDFNTSNKLRYMLMWRGLVDKFTGIKFWTYTKVKDGEGLFDGCKNANVIRSVIPGCGVNYGPCDYVMNTYNTLKAAGKSVTVCPCGVDDSRHCAGCSGCVDYTYTLFLLHSTKDYDAKKDPSYGKFCEFVKAYGC